MRFRLPDESADAEGAIGDEGTNEIWRKEPEDGELRVLGQVLIMAVFLLGLASGMFL